MGESTMSTSIRIRTAQREDLDALVDFSVALALESEGVRLDRATVTKGITAVLKDPTKATYYVAECRTESGAYALAGQLMITYEWSDWRNGTFLWIQSVFVGSEFRRKGVFRALYGHVIERPSEPDVCGVRLYVHHSNENARQTYLNLGMIDAGYSILETQDALLPTESA